MQFVLNGPDIPEELLQAHEEGRVVFFCGAGISYPAKLPGFEDLVLDIYRRCGETRTAIENEAFERKQFDATLDLLEGRIMGSRQAVRRALYKSLKPNLKLPGAYATQAALLQLGRSRQGTLRLVTTNFDRIFHTAAHRINQPFHSYQAPFLPVPKNSRWDGLVYLHGLLPQKIDDIALNRLVVTSGDFGLAYLTERWAARFVTELFRNYVVCFVGYSINDPVLRYMMDALAADRKQGEFTPEAWVLGSCKPGNEKAGLIEWGAKGVKPILYTDHATMHKTLHAWAETYSDGVLGKERIVESYALAQPTASTQQDDFVGRMLWAITDKSGLPAKRFAGHDPAPSLEWFLQVFSVKRFGHGDLIRFQIPPKADVDDKLLFSLIQRPSPYDRATLMVLASMGGASSGWDDVMRHLASWLMRHLDDPRLIIWIANQGGQIHENWAEMINDQITRYASLRLLGKTDELEMVRSKAPKAIPSPLMCKLWRLLLCGRLYSPARGPQLYRWQARFNQEGLTTPLRLELRELLTPRVSLREPFRLGVEEGDPGTTTREPTRIRDLVNWELVLTDGPYHSGFDDVEEERWRESLPFLFDDFQQLLRDALDLQRELGDADELSDRSDWDLPSISPHRQNRGLHDWARLIELLRDAWLTIRDSNPIRATVIAQEWFNFPYPTFKRLALYAASQDGCIPPEQWVDWLLADDAWWLWSLGTGREVFRLIVLQAHHLADADQYRLEQAILVGPPRHMYYHDISDERWESLVTRSIWLHLAKLESSGLALSAEAKQQLVELSNAHPRWQLAADERDEFSHWISGTGDPDFQDDWVIVDAPRFRRKLVKWLTRPEETNRHFYDDTWRDVCRTRCLHCQAALCDLGKQGQWPADRWQEALMVWGESDIVERYSSYTVRLVRNLPDDVQSSFIQGITQWIESASKANRSDQAGIFDLIGHVLELTFPETEGSRRWRGGVAIHDPVFSAFDHPIGHVTQALLNFWFKRKPNDNEGLPDDLRKFFTQICNVSVDRYRSGRVWLGANVIALFRVDRAWTEQHVLPLFNWDNPIEAQALWVGFLHSPRLHRPLLLALKPMFLDCANHYDDLGEHKEQYATFLTYVALEFGEGFPVEEFRPAFAALPQSGLEHSAQALVRVLGSAADQREKYWKNRIRPFWQKVWPKSREHATETIAQHFYQLIITANSELPGALDLLRDWLKPTSHPHYIVYLLQKSGLCTKFPAESLLLLDALIADQQWIPSELGNCLNAIAQASPMLEQDARYLRLRDFSRKRGSA